MTVQAVQARCRKCGSRLVATKEQSCMICGFAIEDVLSIAAPPAVKLQPKPIAIRPPAVFDPSVKEAIMKSYEVLGLVQTAEHFGIKPSTLVLRLRKWGVTLHGRGWKPGQGHGEGKMNGTTDSLSFDGMRTGFDPSKPPVIEVIGTRLGELEEVVVRAAEFCGRANAARAYHAGRLEMLQQIQVMVRQIKGTETVRRGS